MGTEVISMQVKFGVGSNELAKSMTSHCSANNLADFIMSLQNL